MYEDEWEPEIEDGIHETKISLVDNDTFSEAAKYDRPCCLNFASHKRPGGGYKSVIGTRMPIKTQEEDLFRRSNLPSILDTPEVREHYPLMGLRGLYCSCVVDKDKLCNDIEPFEVTLVTLAAVVRPTAAQADLVADKIKRIIDIATDNKQETLILGAWGCGVLHNDPMFVSHHFMKQLRRNLFKEVIFAIPNQQSPVYQVFEQVITSHAR